MGVEVVVVAAGVLVVVVVGSENAGDATAARDAAATARPIAPPVAVCQRRRLWM